MKAGRKLIQLWLLCAAMLPAAVHAQFLFVSTNNVITITGYTGSNSTVVIPKKISGLPVAIIGTSAFANLTNLTSVTLPDTVATISQQAFYNCTGLTNVTLGSGVTIIWNYAFQYCSNLANVTIPAGIQSLGTYAFGYCYGLTGAYFQGNKPSDSGSSFSSDSHAVVYYLPWTTGWGTTYGGAPTAPYVPPLPFNYAVNNGAIIITQYTGPGDTATIPATIYDAYANNFFPVTSIGANAFADCSGLTSVSISSGVASIGTNAFAGCSGLITVAIPNSVTNIGSYAFANCTNLAGAFFASNFPSTGSTIFMNDNNALAYFYHLPPGGGNGQPPSTIGGIPIVLLPYIYTITNGTLVIGSYTGPGGAVAIPGMIGGLPVTSIGNGAFANCSSLTNFTISDGISDIGNGAFAFCGGLTSITIPDSVTDLGIFAFYACSNLASVTISTNISNIGVSAFDSCTGLTNLTIPDGVFIIGASAFQNCAGLTNITVPALVNGIGRCAFDSCGSLLTILVDPQNTNYTSVDGALLWTTNYVNPPTAGSNSNAMFIQCPAGKVGNYAIPTNCISIGNSAFHSCIQLTSVTIPGSVSSIGDWAFDFCSGLTNVTIPAGVTTIGSYSFASCSNLTSVLLPESVTIIGYHTFDDCVGLTNVTIGSGLTQFAPKVGSSTFSDCPSLTSIYLAGSFPYFTWNPTNQIAKPIAYYLPAGQGQMNNVNIHGLPTALWLPRILTADGSFGFQTNQFGFNVTWANGLAVRVDACTNLTQAAWSPVGTTTITNGLSYFTDPQWTNYPGRFYRLGYP